MAAAKGEFILEVPAELAEACPAVAIDAGGSMMKFVYRSRIESSSKENTSQLRLVSFSKSDVQEALDYIRLRADLEVASDGEELPLIRTTGNGCAAFGEIICRTLKVRQKNVSEFDCFADGFVYLATHLTRTQMLHPFDAEASVEAVEFAKNQCSGFALARTLNFTKALAVDVETWTEDRLLSMSGRPSADEDQSPADDIVMIDAEPDMFPCFLAVCGSACGFLEVRKDHSFSVVDIVFRGGRSFLGIGKLLTGCKSYDELIELASNGNYSNVDQRPMENLEVEDIEDEDVEMCMYKMKRKHKGEWIYSFGKAANSETGQMKREDVASAWLRHFANDVASYVHTTALLHGIKRVFFCGGMCHTSPLVRRFITTEMVRRNMLTPQFSQRYEPIVFDFLKHGQHLGALGCLVSGLQQTTS